MAGNNGRVKKLRRSSINRWKRDLKIFDQNTRRGDDLNDNVKNMNSFENLLDDSYENLLAMESGEIPEVMVESESDNEGESARESTVEREATLENNDDFIAFGEDSSESENESGNEQEQESESECELSENESLARGLNPEFPWLLNHNHSKEINISDWLTQEIKDFISYISPNKVEIEQRNKVITKLRRLVKQLWSDSDLHVFGSYATDLYLPGSDIDCVINSTSGDKEHRQYLYDLARHLKSESFATQIEVISRTRVPIIKFVEPTSNLHIDVSFERTNGLDTAKLIREWLDATPGLRELVLIIKQFLSSRRLNDVHTGGLGGFSIICMVYSFIQLHPKVRMNEIDPFENLGVLLIEFFELYGKNFAYDEIALSFNDDEFPIYVPKSHWRALLPVRKQFAIAIQDPRDPSNNISRGSFNLGVIKKTFSGAFDLLTNKCFELNACTFKDRVGKSILGNVIKYKGAARDFKDERDLVINRAIVENERFYSKKRSYITMEETRNDLSDGDSDDDDDDDKDNMFLNPSDDDMITGGHDDTEMYKLDDKTVEILLKKGKKKEKKRLVKKRKIPPPQPTTSSQRRAKSKSVDSLMGLSDHNDDENDTNITSVESTPLPQEFPYVNVKQTKLKKSTVDAQTRRDYWLSKGNTLGNTSVSK